MICTDIDHNFSNCVEKPEIFRITIEFEPVTLHCQRDTPTNSFILLGYEATDGRSWSFVGYSEMFLG